jgi:hypothetical protein
MPVKSIHGRNGPRLTFLAPWKPRAMSCFQPTINCVHGQRRAFLIRDVLALEGLPALMECLIMDLEGAGGFPMISRLDWRSGAHLPKWVVVEVYMNYPRPQICSCAAKLENFRSLLSFDLFVFISFSIRIVSQDGCD